MCRLDDSFGFRRGIRIALSGMRWACKGMPWRAGIITEPHAHHETEDVQMANDQAVDPVCRKTVPMQGAVTRRRDGKTYYFCSETCASRFDADTAVSRLGLDAPPRWPW